MLSININNDWFPIINYQNYCIDLDEEGNQTMQFDIPLDDTYYKLHAETQVKDEYNLWIIKQINQLKSYATITCDINMDAWKSNFILKSAEDVKLQTKTITDALNYIKPSGWTITNGSVRDIKRTLDLEKCTSYDLLMRAKEVYDVQLDIDASNKKITVVDPYEVIDLGVYITPELNLKATNYKGDSNNVVTRLYCYGADDLTFADINKGKPYIENTSFKGAPICAAWTDGRYTNMESLLADGKKKLAEMAVPAGAYTIDVVDLQAIDVKYKNLEMRLRSTVHCIVNPERKIDVIHRIVKKRIYPDTPALNKITLSNQPRTLEKEWNALKENVDSVRKDGFKRETEIRQNNKEIELVAKETEENTKGVKEVKQKITPEQILMTVSESINKGNKLNTMQVIIDLLGLTIKNGGLKVYDGNNNLVMFVDEKTKNLTFNGMLQSTAGMIGGWKIDAGGLFSEYEWTTPAYTENDLKNIRDYINEEGTLTDEQISYYDVSRRGAISALDYVLIRNIINGVSSRVWKYRIRINTGNVDGIISIDVDRGAGYIAETRITSGGIINQTMTSIYKSISDHGSELVEHTHRMNELSNRIYNLENK